jgi:hypothetical protein
MATVVNNRQSSHIPSGALDKTLLVAPGIDLQVAIWVALNFCTRVDKSTYGAINCRAYVESVTGSTILVHHTPTAVCVHKPVEVQPT